MIPPIQSYEPFQSSNPDGDGISSLPISKPQTSPPISPSLTPLFKNTYLNLYLPFHLRPPPFRHNHTASVAKTQQLRFLALSPSLAATSHNTSTTLPCSINSHNSSTKSPPPLSFSSSSPPTYPKSPLPNLYKTLPSVWNAIHRCAGNADLANRANSGIVYPAASGASPW